MITKKIAKIIDRDIAMEKNQCNNRYILNLHCNIIFLKMKAWDNGDEYRCSFGKTPDNNYFTAIPCLIYMGAKCNKEKKD